MVKVLLCGTPAVRARLRRLLEQVSEDVRVVGEAPSAGAAVLLTRRFAPHLVLLAEEPTDGDYASLADDIQGASSQQASIVLVPDHALSDEEIVGVEAILPRDRYSNRAMTAVLQRIVRRM